MRKFRVAMFVVATVLVALGAFVSLLGQFQSAKALPEQKNNNSTVLPAEDCVDISPEGFGGGQVLTTTWPSPAPTATLCAIVTWPYTGSVHLTRGWVFTAPITSNVGLETYILPTELAPQIREKSAEVSAGEPWFIKVSPQPSGSELGIVVTYDPPLPEVHRVYLPIVSAPPPAPVVEYRNVTLTGDFQVPLPASWPAAVEGQTYCLQLNLSGQAGQMESGWFFGSSPQFWVNDVPTNVPFTPETPAGAGQVGSVSLPLAPAGVARTLKVCVTETLPTGAEIGLRVR